MGKPLIRVNNARLFVVTDEYIDYWEYPHYTEGKRHGFAKIDPIDFPIDYKEPHSDLVYNKLECLRDTLQMAIKDDLKVNLILEKRKIDKQYIDYLIKIEIAWQES